MRMEESDSRLSRGEPHGQSVESVPVIMESSPHPPSNRATFHSADSTPLHRSLLYTRFETAEDPKGPVSYVARPFPSETPLGFCWDLKRR